MTETVVLNDYVKSLLELAKKNNYNYALLNNPKLNDDQAWFIYVGLSDPTYTVEDYAKDEFSAEQMYQIMRGQEHGIDYKEYLNPEYPAGKMLVIREALEDGEDVKAIKEADNNTLFTDLMRLRFKNKREKTARWKNL